MKCKLTNAVKLLFFSIVLTLVSCDFNELPEPPKAEETPITNLKSFEIIPGKNKVWVKGVIDDPTITRVDVTWNNKEQLLSIPVDASKKADTINTEIDNLEEKLYLFEVNTVDNKGNISASLMGGTDVLGDVFLGSLKNRVVNSGSLINSQLSVSFEVTNQSSTMFGTELVYNNIDGDEKKVFLKKTSNNLYISDYKAGGSFKYRSGYLFSPVNTKDTIYTEYSSFKPFLVPVLENSVSPFTVAESGGRWGTLAAPWITNDAAKNHGGYGGHDSKNGSFFNIESGWSAPAVINGKIYQVLTLDPGNYEVILTINDTNYKASDDGGAYIMIAKGAGLPNVEEIDTVSEVINYARIDGPSVYTVEFTLKEISEISFGLLSTQDASGKYGKITAWELNGTPLE